MSHINSDAPLHSDPPLEKKRLKKVGAHRNAFLRGAHRRVSVTWCHALTGFKVNIMIFQKTILNRLILLTYYFFSGILNKCSRIFERKTTGLPSPVCVVCCATVMAV